MGILTAVIGLALLIIVHELGHMWVAKRCGIGVYEFSIGMGPKIFSRRSGETLYSLRLFPFGGFVRLEGIDEESHETADPSKDYHQKSLSARMATIVAGAAANILTGFIIFLAISLFFGVPELNNKISTVILNSPAAKAGLEKGDRIIRVNGQTVVNPENDIIHTIRNSQTRNGVSAVSLLIERNGQEFSKFLRPVIDPNRSTKPTVGILLDYNTVKLSPLTAFRFSVEKTGFTIKSVFSSIRMLVTGTVSLKDMAGPIGIVQIASVEFHSSVLNFLSLLAFISISLGVVNLFPFPALDGGHFILLILEGIRGKALGKKVETWINYIGFSLLIFMMVVIVLNDILHWNDRVRLLARPHQAQYLK